MRLRDALRRRYALPTEHGTWAWWIGPFVMGAAAGGHPHGGTVALLVGVLAGFLLHQPAAVAVRALAGRRPREEAAPALLWAAAYGALAAATAPCLVAHGQAKVLWLALPAGVLFAVHLALVARRADRRRMDVEVLAGGVLALAAPAAYWVAGGHRYPEPWALWTIAWAQTAASIANVYLRLEQRGWRPLPPAAARWRAGRTTLALHAVALAVGLAWAASGHAPWGVALPLAAVLADALDTVARPWPGARPVRIGLRQLAADAVFVGLVVAVWR